MVRYQRYHQWRKGGEATENDEESQFFGLMETGYYKRTRPKLVSLLLLFILSCCFLFAPQLFNTPSFINSLQQENESLDVPMDLESPLCNSAICCDRSGFRSDICMIRGDVRTHSPSSSVFVYNSNRRNSFKNYVSSIVDENEGEQNEELQHENIKPYTRKWETSIMDKVDELYLVSKKTNLAKHHQCDVEHDVPAVFFSTGGYTGNVYHEFNDGLLPLFITTQHLNKKVIFVILEYHNWWVMKYGDILSNLSDYPPIDFSGDRRTHCFPKAIAGLRIHGDLTVDPSLMERNQSIVDFRNLLDRAYWPRIQGIIKYEEREAHDVIKDKFSPSPSSKVIEDLEEKPKMVIISRNGSRAIMNEDLLVKMAEEIGFRVEVLKPDPRTELAKIYRALNSSQVMVGVHGAAMTHFLFMKPSSVFIQIIPLGTVWPAETFYGEPAKKFGLKYIGYKILTRESSLSDKFDKNDPVLKDPDSVTQKGWEYTKSLYLDSQNVRLDLARFQKHLIRAYSHSLSRLDQHPYL